MVLTRPGGLQRCREKWDMYRRLSAVGRNRLLRRLSNRMVQREGAPK